MWGTWWEWDGRLTSVLVMFLLYIAYIALRASMDDEQKAARAAAILALVGSINLPIIHFSVEWWNSIHQGTSLFREGGPSMPPVFYVPLILMMLAYMSAFGSLWLVRIRGELWRRRAEAAALVHGVIADGQVTPETWRTIKDLLARHGAIDAAFERAVTHATLAKTGLAAAFPPSAERDGLISLADYVLSRDR